MLLSVQQDWVAILLNSTMHVDAVDCPVQQLILCAYCILYITDIVNSVASSAFGIYMPVAPSTLGD